MASASSTGPLKNLSEDETSVLIDLFRNHKALWDMRSDEYRNKNQRAASWSSIRKTFTLTTNVECTEENVQAKILSLRNQFTRELRKERESLVKNELTSSDKVFKSVWPFFKHMKFLLPVICVVQQTPTNQKETGGGLTKLPVSQKLKFVDSQQFQPLQTSATDIEPEDYHSVQQFRQFQPLQTSTTDTEQGDHQTVQQVKVEILGTEDVSWAYAHGNGQDTEGEMTLPSLEMDPDSQDQRDIEGEQSRLHRSNGTQDFDHQCHSSFTPRTKRKQNGDNLDFRESIMEYLASKKARQAERAPRIVDDDPDFEWAKNLTRNIKEIRNERSRKLLKLDISDMVSKAVREDLMNTGHL